MEEKDTLQDFLYTYVETGWFDHEREKTLEAMKRLWKTMPQTDIDQLPARLIVFAPAAIKLGQTYPWLDSGTREEGTLIYLAPELELMSQSEIDITVAHEFAHAVLGHGKCGSAGTETKEALIRQADVPHEREADELITKWGYAPAYNRRPNTAKPKRLLNSSRRTARPKRKR
jgi:hypothetical protein